MHSHLNVCGFVKEKILGAMGLCSLDPQQYAADIHGHESLGGTQGLIPLAQERAQRSEKFLRHHLAKKSRLIQYWYTR